MITNKLHHQFVVILTFVCFVIFHVISAEKDTCLIVTLLDYFYTHVSNSYFWLIPYCHDFMF